MGMQNDVGTIDFVANWWVGDFFASGSPPNPFGHFWLYGHNSDHISDYAVRSYATNYGSVSSKQMFNFIWTCANGGLWWNDNSGNYDNVSGVFYPIPTVSPAPTNTNDEYGFLYSGNSAVGMPYAWTGRIDMDIDGYNNWSGDYCYIGFEGNSPFLTNNLPEFSVLTFWFPYAFYQCFLGADEDVHNSLDYASDQTYECNFDETPLYNGYWRPHEPDPSKSWRCCMRVFGNGGLTSPY